MVVPCEVNNKRKNKQHQNNSSLKCSKYDKLGKKIKIKHSYSGTSENQSSL